MEWETTDEHADEQIITICLISAAAILLQLQKQRRPRRYWVRPINQRRAEQGAYDNLVKELRNEEPDLFFNYTRMDVRLFDKLLNLVTPYIVKKSNRPSISPGARLALTLRYLAAGGSMHSIAFEYRIGVSTTSVIIKETCEAIWCALQPTYIPSPTEEIWKEAEKGFAQKWNLPNCIGAMDGKHIVMKAPNKSGSLFYNYKKHYSSVLFAVCDASYKFLYIDVGSYGSQSDGGILQQSTLGKSLDNNTLDLPEHKPLPYTETPISHFLVGDEAFPLKTEIMRPYSGRYLEEEKVIFNYRLSRARRCIENAFGILASRWRIFHQTIYAFPETVDQIVKATVCLHNYIMDHQPDIYCNNSFIDSETEDRRSTLPGKWRDEMGRNPSLKKISRRLGARNAKANAIEMRDHIKNYLSTLGAVPWQLNHVRAT